MISIWNRIYVVAWEDITTIHHTTIQWSRSANFQCTKGWALYHNKEKDTEWKRILKRLNGLATGQGSSSIHKLQIHYWSIICRLHSVRGTYHNEFSVYQEIRITDLDIRNWITPDLDSLAMQGWNTKTRNNLKDHSHKYIAHLHRLCHVGV